MNNERKMNNMIRNVKFPKNCEMSVLNFVDICLICTRSVSSTISLFTRVEERLTLRFNNLLWLFTLEHACGLSNYVVQDICTV